MHYFGKNLATMRTIVVILAMAAVASSQERTGYADMESINGTFLGRLHYHQPSPDGEVHLFGNLIGGFDRTLNWIALHERTKLTGNCSSIGRIYLPLDEESHEPMSAENAWREYLIRHRNKNHDHYNTTVDITSYQVRPLAPNKYDYEPAGAIAFHDVVTMDDDKFMEYGDRDSVLACGIVVHDSPSTTNITATTTPTTPSANTIVALATKSTTPSTNTIVALATKRTTPSTNTIVAPTTREATTAGTTPSGFCGFINSIGVFFQGIFSWFSVDS